GRSNHVSTQVAHPLDVRHSNPTMWDAGSQLFNGRAGAAFNRDAYDSDWMPRSSARNVLWTVSASSGYERIVRNHFHFTMLVFGCTKNRLQGRNCSHWSIHR